MIHLIQMKNYNEYFYKAINKIIEVAKDLTMDSNFKVPVKREFLLTSEKNRPYLRSKDSKYLFTEDDVKGVVIHWTANTSLTADADNNAKFFNTRTDFGSCQFAVDDYQIVIAIPDNEVAWHVGDKPRAGRTYPRRSELLEGTGLTNPNYCTIGIEMCVNSEKVWDKVLDNTTDLAAYLLNKWNLDEDDLYRHFDLTGKDCPKMLLPTVVNNKEYDWNWIMFKMLVKQKLEKYA